jgi:hypothetical protein
MAMPSTMTFSASAQILVRRGMFVCFCRFLGEGDCGCCARLRLRLPEGVDSAGATGEPSDDMLPSIELTDEALLPGE